MTKYPLTPPKWVLNIVLCRGLPNFSGWKYSAVVIFKTEDSYFKQNKCKRFLAPSVCFFSPRFPFLTEWSIGLMKMNGFVLLSGLHCQPRGNASLQKIKWTIEQLTAVGNWASAAQRYQFTYFLCFTDCHHVFYVFPFLRLNILHK